MKKPKLIYVLWNEWDATFSLHSTEEKAWAEFVRLAKENPGSWPGMNPVEVREVDGE